MELTWNFHCHVERREIFWLVQWLVWAR